MDDLKALIGARIRAARRACPVDARVQRGRRRQARKVSIRQLAASAGISPDYLARLERGQYAPSTEVLAKAAQALGVPIATLLPEDETGGADKAQAIAELVAFVSRFSGAEIQRIYRVARAVLDDAGG